MPGLRWTDVDDDFIRYYYPLNTAEWCANFLDRSMSAIQIRAGFLGVKAVGRKGCRTIRNILYRLDDGFVVCLCPKHGETEHKQYDNDRILCVVCSWVHEDKRRNNRIWTDRSRKLARLRAKRRRATALGRYTNRIRVALRQCSMGRISFSKHLPYRAKQLCEYLECVRRKQQNRCPACSRSYNDVQDSIDHIIPVSMASTDSELLSLFALDNLSLLCLSCNSSKGARI